MPTKIKHNRIKGEGLLYFVRCRGYCTFHNAPLNFLIYINEPKDNVQRYTKHAPKAQEYILP